MMEKNPPEYTLWHKIAVSCVDAEIVASDIPIVHCTYF